MSAMGMGGVISADILPYAALGCFVPLFQGRGDEAGVCVIVLALCVGSGTRETTVNCC